MNNFEPFLATFHVMPRNFVHQVLKGRYAFPLTSYINSYSYLRKKIHNNVF